MRSAREWLHCLGYIEGQNIAIEWRYAQGKYDQVPDLAAELVRLKVDIIVTAVRRTAIQPAKKATTTIPIVMINERRSCRSRGSCKPCPPGGNITGLRVFPRTRR